MAKAKAGKVVKSKPKKVVKEKATAKTKAAKVSAKVTKKAAPAPPPPGVEKKEIIEQFQIKVGDTGSPEVQVALLTKRIDKLVGHLKANPADNHSRRGLLGIVSKRRRLLNYLEKKDIKRYKNIAGKLGLGK